MATKTKPMYDILAEIIPQVVEGAVLTLARTEPAYIQEHPEFYILIPIPYVLVKDMDLETVFSRNAVREALPAPFSYILTDVKTMTECMIQDVDGEIVFDLGEQKMSAVRFTFTAPSGWFED